MKDRLKEMERKQPLYDLRKACLQGLKIKITTSNGIEITHVVRFFHGDGPQQDFEAGEHRQNFLNPGTPVLALTGTAEKKAEKTVIKKPIHLFVSPNRSNLRFSVNKVSTTDMLGELDWLVELIKKFGKDTPKTIVFCDTMYSIASVFNHLMMSLGENAFHPNTSRKRIDCFIGLFHSVSHKDTKRGYFFRLKTMDSSVLPLLPLL